jgi:hypothetical protein
VPAAGKSAENRLSEEEVKVNETHQQCETKFVLCSCHLGLQNGRHVNNGAYGGELS